MKKEEKAKLLKWELFDPCEKHMVLMYLYRTETEPLEELEFYIETHWFRKRGVKRSDLPSWYLTLGPAKLRQLAYDVIGKTQPDALPREIA